MQLHRDLDQLPASAQGVALALGNFDGLHLGHCAILEETLKQAKALSCPAAVMTFEPHPREFFAPDAPKLRLMRLKEKMQALTDMGFSYLYLPHFNKALATTSAEDFVYRLLVEKLKVRHIITGNNFCFGAKRRGNSAYLSEASKQYGFSYHAMNHIVSDAGIISSTAIRKLLSEGQVVAANQLLGHAYTIAGHVAHGDKRGRTIGFPTANIPMHDLFLPKFGVYKVRVTLDGKEIAGVANIGARPTVGGIVPRAEIHLFDFTGDLYGKYIRATLHRFLREEKTFANIDALKAQITQDCEEARK
jgi:riboflavin kinase/FMN adenylyltransferase